MTSFVLAAAAHFSRRAPRAAATVLQFSNTVRVEAPLAPLASAAAAGAGESSEDDADGGGAGDAAEAGAEEDGALALFGERVRRMARMNGGTNIAAALAAAGAALKAAGAASPRAGKLVILLTDGRVDGYQSREARVRFACLCVSGGRGGSCVPRGRRRISGDDGVSSKRNTPNEHPPTTTSPIPNPPPRSTQETAARLADEMPGARVWALGVGRGVDRGELARVLSGAAAAAPPRGGGGGGGGGARYLDLCVRDDAPW